MKHQALGAQFYISTLFESQFYILTFDYCDRMIWSQVLGI